MMRESKEQILTFFKNDLESSSSSVPKDDVLSERDEVLIMYRSHYPQYREGFDEILENESKFFDFGLDIDE